MEVENNSNNGNGVCSCCCHKSVSFPPGYKFNPTDEELVDKYLKKKLMKKLLPFNQFMRNKIVEIDIYKQTNPEKLADLNKLTSGEKDWYFFTPRNRKYPNGDRPNRTAGDGYWKATGADKAVMSKGVVVGYRKSLVFYIGKPPRGEKTNWIMHEYRYNGPARKRTSTGDMKLDDFVLCRIYKKPVSTKSKSLEEKEVAVVTKEESPAESALDKNQINQGERIDEDNEQLVQPSENVGMFMNQHNVEQQQRLPVNSYNTFGTQPSSQSGFLDGYIPEIKNLHFPQSYHDQHHVPTNELNYEFQQQPSPPPPPPQIVQPYGFAHPSMYKSMESDVTPRDDDYLTQQLPMKQNLIPWDGDYLSQPPQQWEHQQGDELCYLLQSLPESDETSYLDLVTTHESHFGQNNSPGGPHGPNYD